MKYYLITNFFAIIYVNNRGIEMSDFENAMKCFMVITFRIDSTKDTLRQPLVLIDSTINVPEISNLHILKECFSYLNESSNVCKVYGTSKYKNLIKKNLSGNKKNYGFYLPVVIKRKKYAFFVKVWKNISEQKTYIIFSLEDNYGLPGYEELLKEDFCDPLTNLFNRNIYEYKINKITGNNFIGLIDIDNFKKINDIYTHHVGDRIIRNVGSILKKINNCHITFFRIGGDEFVFYTEDLTYEKTISYLNKAIEQVNNIKLNGSRVFCSIGMVKYDGLENQDVKDYRIYADLAMYKSKEEGGNRITFFEPEYIKTIIKDEKVIKLIKGLKK